MVKNTTTVLLSLGGSLIINIIGVYIQHRLTERSQANRDKESWYREVVSQGNNVRRACLSLSAGIRVDPTTLETMDENNREGIEKLKTEIEQLYQKCGSAPPEINDEIVQEIQDLRNWIHQPNFRSDTPTTTELREDGRERVEKIMEKIYKESSDMDNFPY